MTKCKNVLVIYNDDTPFSKFIFEFSLMNIFIIFSSLFHNHTYPCFNIHVISAIYINVASVTYKGNLKHELKNALMPRT